MASRIGLLRLVVVFDDRARQLLLGGGVGGGEVGLEVTLTEHLGARVEVDGLVGDGDGDKLDIGDDADTLNGDAVGRAVAAWREILRDGQLEGRAVVHFEHVLHAAFAEAPLTDDDGAVVVLEGACHNLARGGRAGVHEQHQRVVGLGAGAVGADLVAELVGLTHGGDDGARLEEEVGDADGLAKEPTGLFRRSRTSPFMPPISLDSAFTASPTSRAVLPASRAPARSRCCWRAPCSSPTAPRSLRARRYTCGPPTSRGA